MELLGHMRASIIVQNGDIIRESHKMLVADADKTISRVLSVRWVLIPKKGFWDLRQYTLVIIQILFLLTVKIVRIFLSENLILCFLGYGS